MVSDTWALSTLGEDARRTEGGGRALQFPGLQNRGFGGGPQRGAHGLLRHRPHVGPPEGRHQADHLSDQGGGDQREDDHRWEWAMMGRGCKNTLDRFVEF